MVSVILALLLWFGQDLYFKHLEHEAERQKERDIVLIERDFRKMKNNIKEIEDFSNIVIANNGMAENWQDIGSKQEIFSQEIDKAILEKSIKQAQENDMKFKLEINAYKLAQEKSAKIAHILPAIKVWECDHYDRACKKDSQGNFVAYLDAVGIPTIGWGNTSFLRKNPHIKSITPEKAQELLEQDVWIKIAELKRKDIDVFKYSLEQQIGSVSEAFHVGAGGFKSMLDQKNMRYITHKMILTAGGEIYNSFEKRRNFGQCMLRNNPYKYCIQKYKPIYA